jgi:hypothetical protein
LNAGPNDFEARAMIESGEILGPTSFLAPSLGGIPAQAIKAMNGMARVGAPFYEQVPLPGFPHSADDGRQFVLEAHEAGADYIKVNVGVPLVVFDAIVETADELGLKVTGHVSGQVGVPHQLNSGVEIQHADEIYPYLSEVTIHDLTVLHEDDLLLWDENLPEVIDLHLAKNLPFTPTLITIVHATGQLRDLESIVQQPGYSYLPPAEFQQVANPETNAWYQYASFGLGRLEYQEVVRARALQLAKALFDGGVMLLAGTDSGFGGGPIVGFSLHEELSLFVDAGLTPYQSLETATRNPATAFGQSDEWGTIEVGKRADIVLLNTNPLGDIHNTTDIAGVMVRGQWLPQAQLQQNLDDIVASYDEMSVVELEPVSNEEMGFDGVLPSGWAEIQSGTYTRSNPDSDPTFFVQMAVPSAASEETVAGIIGEFGATELSDPIDSFESASLSWNFYAPEGQLSMALGLAEKDHMVYIVMVVALPTEIDQLAETLLFPAVEALTPK